MTTTLSRLLLILNSRVVKICPALFMYINGIRKYKGANKIPARDRREARSCCNHHHHHLEALHLIFLLIYSTRQSVYMYVFVVLYNNQGEGQLIRTHQAPYITH